MSHAVMHCASVLQQCQHAERHIAFIAFCPNDALGIGLIAQSEAVKHAVSTFESFISALGLIFVWMQLES